MGFDTSDLAGISVTWSPVNVAWFVLFGDGPVGTRSVLSIIGDPYDVEDYLEDLRRRPEEGTKP